MSRRDHSSRPWCKIWTMLDLQDLLTSFDFSGELYAPTALTALARTDPESRARIVYDSFHKLDRYLIPLTDQRKPTGTVLIQDSKAGSPPKRRLTVSIESITFLERTMLEMRIDIEKTEDDAGDESQEQCVILE
ncbi:uncharacterized protein PG986_008175 [Apiospora aurea]|uniref:Uncharacterized protein n=1 Tax=Apiospora aurea TaxID=335848 RepID=A0ABR1QEQ3_9PEZI